VSNGCDYQELPDGQWTFRQLMGTVVFAFLGPFLAWDFWAHHGHSMFFDFLGPQSLMVVGTFGGVLCLWQFADPRENLQAIVSGALMGFGATGLMSLYAIWVNRDIYHEWEILGISLAGSLPGIAVFILIRRLRNRD
jgi:prepilin signal peptidase PulO-like enzyme (type II secretory pathway)